MIPLVAPGIGEKSLGLPDEVAQPMFDITSNSPGKLAERQSLHHCHRPRTCANSFECYSILTLEQMKLVDSVCGFICDRSFESTFFRKGLTTPRKYIGWMCAQMRPVDGLHLALQQYRNGRALTGYLLIIDDDKCVNLGFLASSLLDSYRANITNVVNGCEFAACVTKQTECF